MRALPAGPRDGGATVLEAGKKIVEGVYCREGLGQIARVMNTPTLAEKLGTTARSSSLLHKAQRLGLTNAIALEWLAVARGCWHYRQPETPEPSSVDESEFTNEELAIALLLPNQPYSPHTIRLGAAMLGAVGNDPEKLTQLAKTEGSEMVVRYIAKAGLQFEPDNPLWHALLESLPEKHETADGILPHPTRFVSMTGFTRNDPGKVTVWIRPRADLAFAH